MTAGHFHELRAFPVRIDEGATLAEVISAVSEARGRPIRVVELASLAPGGVTSLCGMWLSTPTEDIILHAPTESVLHREQFILHELAHMILRHDNLSGISGQSRVPLPARVPDGRIVLAPGLGEGFYAQERDAESKADELAAAIRRPRRSTFQRVFG